MLLMLYIEPWLLRESAVLVLWRVEQLSTPSPEYRAQCALHRKKLKRNGLFRVSPRGLTDVSEVEVANASIGRALLHEVTDALGRNDGS